MDLTEIEKKLGKVLKDQELINSLDTFFQQTDYLYRNINFYNKNVLDIGGGAGLYSFYASVKGANKVFCLEPYAEGSNNKMQEKFNQIKDSIEYDLPQVLKVYIEREKIVYPTANIIGVIPGKKEENQNVIISAHYDHLGKYKDIMFPGANDNASGVSILIELARVFSNAYQSGIKPKHNIIFLAFSAEETGVLGSEYFVENPPFSLERTIANINIDMVGRQDQYHDTIPNYIYAIAPDSLNQPIKKVMDSLNIFHNLVSLSFMEKHPAGKKFFSQASDQRHFLEKNIPAILLFNGIHKDLHKPTDTPEKLNYQTIENVGELIFMTVWELANKP